MPTGDDFDLPILPDEHVKSQFPYMKNLIKASSLVNMWPKPKEASSFLYHLKLTFVFCICISLILSFALEIQKEFNNLDTITSLIDFFTVFISGTFRFVYIYVRGEKYLELVSMIHNNFIHYPLISDSKQTSLQRYYKTANKLIVVYCTFTSFWVLQTCTLPGINYALAIANLPPNSNETVPYPVPYRAYTPFDQQKQPANALFYIYQCVSFTIFGWIYITVDSFWYMVILLTIGQFTLVKDSLNIIKDVLEKSEIQNEGQSEGQSDFALLKDSQIRKVGDGLKSCVMHHQFLRKFVRTLDDIINPIVLIDSLHAVISIGFLLLDMTISINTHEWGKALYSLEYFITSIVHMFFFDWLGNELAEREIELAEVVYDIPWYKCPTEKATFVLMFIQSRRPHRLTGGRMYKLTLEFFSSTIRAVFSYFTFLLQMRNSEPKLN